MSITIRPNYLPKKTTKPKRSLPGNNLPEAAKILVDIIELDPENYRALSGSLIKARL